MTQICKTLKMVLMLYLVSCGNGQGLHTRMLTAGTVLERAGGVYTEQVSRTFQIMIPIIPKAGITPSACGASVIDAFLSDVRQTLSPFSQINNLRNELMGPKEGTRIAGVIVGVAAMGVATGAAITAGVALDTAYKNKRDIQQLRTAMSETLNAVENLKDATKGLTIIVNDLAKRINEEIIPAIDNLTCEVSKANMRSALASLFNRWLITYSPILESPLEPHSSALLASSALRDGLEAGLKIESTNDDLMRSAMEGLISIQLMEYDPETLTVLLLVSIKAVNAIPGALVYRTTSLMFPIGSPPEQARVSLPRYVIRSNSAWYSPGSECTPRYNGLGCEGSPLSPFNEKLDQCLNGALDTCVWEKPSSGSSFVLLSEGILADCTTLSCICEDGTAQRGLVYLSADCGLVTINGDRYRITPEDLGYFVSNKTVVFPHVPAANISFIDVSAMDSIKDSLSKSEEALKRAQEALRGVSDGKGSSVETMVALGCGITGMLVLLLVALGAWLWNKAQGKMPAVPFKRNKAADAAYDNPIHHVSSVDIRELDM